MQPYSLFSAFLLWSSLLPNLLVKINLAFLYYEYYWLLDELLLFFCKSLWIKASAKGIHLLVKYASIKISTSPEFP